MFRDLEQDALLYQRGVYRQVKLGYVRLYENGCTSVPNLQIESVTWGDGPIFVDRFGRLRSDKGREIGENKPKFLLGVLME